MENSQERRISGQTFLQLEANANLAYLFGNIYGISKLRNTAHFPPSQQLTRCPFQQAPNTSQSICTRAFMLTGSSATSQLNRGAHADSQLTFIVKLNKNCSISNRDTDNISRTMILSRSRVTVFDLQ